MGLDVSDPTVKTKITMLSCGIVAVFMTIWRLWMRRGRFWWDDGWAFFSLLSLFAQFAAVFLRGVPEPNHLSRTTKVASYYLMASTFYAVIWSARQSILFSVIRLQPDPAIRKRLYYCSAAMLATVIILLAQLYWVCEPLDQKEHWKLKAVPQCHLPKQVAILQLVTDILADALLVWAPLQMIKQLANKGLRRRLMFIFSTSVVTTIVSLVHAAYIVTEGGLKVLISALVEDSVSLMVANLPVLVTAAMRAYGVRVIDEDSVPTARLTTMRFDPFAKGTGAGTTQTQTQTGFFRSIFTRSRLAPPEGGVSNDGSTTLNGTTGTVWKDGEEGTRTYRLDELRSRHSAELDGKATGEPRHVHMHGQEPCQYTEDCRYDGPYDGPVDDARKVTGDALGRGV